MKRRISMTTRKELTEALRSRYRSATFGERVKILDEFVALTGYHRKHAIRVLGEQAAGPRTVPARNRLYDEAVRQALTVLWEAADRVCGKRLKALIPTLVDAIEHCMVTLTWIRSFGPRSCKLAQRPSTVHWPRRASTSTGSASVARAWVRRSGAVSLCGPLPTGGIHRQASSR